MICTDEYVYPEVGEVVHSLNQTLALTGKSWGALWSKVKSPTRCKGREGGCKGNLTNLRRAISLKSSQGKSKVNI
jgi:hypothetical protein